MIFSIETAVMKEKWQVLNDVKESNQNIKISSFIEVFNVKLNSIARRFPHSRIFMVKKSIFARKDVYLLLIRARGCYKNFEALKKIISKHIRERLIPFSLAPPAIKAYLNDASYLQFLSARRTFKNATIVSPSFPNAMKHLWRFPIILFFARSSSRLNRSLLEHESDESQIAFEEKRFKRGSRDSFFYFELQICWEHHMKLNFESVSGCEHVEVVDCKLNLEMH